MRGVGPWCHPVKLVLRLPGNQVKVLLTEPAVCNLQFNLLLVSPSLSLHLKIVHLNVGDGVVPHIVQVVLHHNVHPLHQVFVVDLQVYIALKETKNLLYPMFFLLTCFDIKILACPSSPRAELTRAVKIIGIKGDMVEV